MSKRLLLLVSLFVLTAAWAASRVIPTARREPAITQSSPAGTSRPAAVKPIPVVTKIAIPPEVTQPSDGELRRNPFKYAAEYATPPPAPPPPPPPPPPPQIKPDATFIGTADDNGLMALFSHKGAIDALKEGDLLENKYIVKRIEPETVLLEDRNFHNTATLALSRR